MLDLTPEGHLHQRIISVGHDPVLETPHPLYIASQILYDEERKAFSFKVNRKLHSTNENNGLYFNNYKIAKLIIWIFRASFGNNTNGFCLVHTFTSIFNGTTILCYRV